MAKKIIHLGSILLAVLLWGALGLGCAKTDLKSPDPERRAVAVLSLRVDRDSSALLVAQGDSSPLVRASTARAYARSPNAAAVEALGKLVLDPDPTVATAAAEGLGEMPDLPQAGQALRLAYGGATPAGRAAVASALAHLGVSLREAVETESRTLWNRNVSALASRGTARLGAAEELGASQRKEAVKRLLPLAQASKNPDAQLLAAAARGLAETGDWSTRAALEDLLDSNDPVVEEAAVSALGRLGDPNSADALAAIATGASSRVATIATQALTELPDVSEVGLALCEVALRTDDPSVAALAARGAATREAACSIRPLLQRLMSPDRAASALAAMAELHHSDGDSSTQASVRVLRLLEPPADSTLRTLAARAVVRLKSPGAAPVLVRRATAVLAQLKDLRTRSTNGPPGKMALVREPSLNTQGGGPSGTYAVDTEGRELVSELGALLEAIGNLGAPGGRDLLIQGLSDPSGPVRAGAVAGLVALEGLTPEVGKALEDPDLSVRLSASKGLAARSVGAEALVAAASEAKDPAWRVALARALDEVGGAESVPALGIMLQDPQSAPAAAAALGRIGTPAASKILAEALQSARGPTQGYVLDALTQLGARDIGPSVVTLLTSDLPEVRASAARAAGKLGFEEAAPYLEALRSDYYGRVRRAAVEALAKLPGSASRAQP